MSLNNNAHHADNAKIFLEDILLLHRANGLSTGAPQNSETTLASALPVAYGQNKTHSGSQG